MSLCAYMQNADGVLETIWIGNKNIHLYVEIRGLTHHEARFQQHGI